MRPVLFRSDVQTFNSQGLGTLSRVTECTVKEELNNGVYELNLTVIGDDPLIENVTVGNIIAVKPNKTDPRQAFVITNVTKPINNLYTVYAIHIAQFFQKITPEGLFTASTLDEALANMYSFQINDTPLRWYRDSGKNNVSATMTVSRLMSSRELMQGTEGSIVDTYGGEWYFDNFNSYLFNKRGRNNGTQVKYGVNMTAFNLSEDYDFSNSATAAIGFWQRDEEIVASDIQYADSADLFPYQRVTVADFTDRFEEKPTQAQLDTLTASWIKSKGSFPVNITVAFDHLQNADSLQLGDSVQVINRYTNTNYKSRITGYVFDVLADEFREVTIGELKQSVNEAISGIFNSTEEAYDTTPIQGSKKAVESGGIYDALTEKADKTDGSLTWNIKDGTVPLTLRRAGTSPTYGLSLVANKNGTNQFFSIIAVDSQGNIERRWVYPYELTNGLATKQDTLSWDTAPTSGSAKPVTSDGIYDSLYGAFNDGSITFDSGVTNGSGTIRRCGRMVMINIQWTAPATVTANHVIATLPAGFRPLFTMNATAVQRWGQACCPVSFNANGNITHLSTAYTASRQYSCCLTFIRAI